MTDKTGKFVVFSNDRLGNYRRREVPEALAGPILAVVSADINGDGRMDFVLLRNDFAVLRLAEKNGNAGWDFAEIARSKPSAQSSLTVADLDNNGALDLIVGDQIFLSDGKKFTLRHR